MRPKNLSPRALRDIGQAVDDIAGSVSDGIVGGEGFTDGQERTPLVAHQMGREIDGFAQHSAGLTLRQIAHHPGPRCPGWRTLLKLPGPSNHSENRRFRGPRLALAAATQAGTTRVSARAPANVELVDLDGAAELLLAGHQQSQGMTHAPGCWLADPDRLG